MTPAPQPHPLRCPIRPEVLAFAMRMEMALRKHDKGRGDSYKESDSEYLLKRLHTEVSELEEALQEYEDTPYPQKNHLLADSVVKVLSEGADVGNFAMMCSYGAYPSHNDLLNYISAWNLPCASHSASSDKVLDELPHMTSTDLLLIAHDEWKRREERKHNHKESGWIAGWINGFMTSKKWAQEKVKELRLAEKGEREQG